MKVPGTRDPETSIWVKCVHRRSPLLSSDCSTQYCHSDRKMKAMRRPKAQGNLWHRTSHVKANGHLGHEQPPIQGRSWSIVPCSRHLPEMTQSGLSNKTARFTTRDYMGAILKDSLDMIEGLTPCQTLGKLTCQTQTERCDICWKKGSPMTGQQLYRKIFQIFFNEKNHCSTVSTRSPRREFGHTDVFSHKD